MRRSKEPLRELKGWVEEGGGSISVRVIDLLDLFELPAWNASARSTLDDALSDAGLHASQPLHELERWYSLRLSASLTDSHPKDEPIRAFSLSTSGEVTEVPQLDEAFATPELLWIDLGTQDLTGLESLIRRLADRDGEERLSERDVEKIADDIRRPDARPRVHVFGERATTRTSSFVEVRHRERDDLHPEDVNKAGHLVVNLVEFLSGRKFIVTRRFPAEVLTGGLRRTSARRIDAPDSLQAGTDIDRLVKAVTRRWRRASARARSTGRELGAGDVGMVIVHELSESLEKARRAISTWLDQWELEWINPDRGVERETVAVVRVLVDEFRDRLAPLQYPYGGDPVVGWFAEVRDKAEAVHVHALITRTLRDLDALQERVRGAFDLLEITVGDRTRRRIETIGFALLLPTLVAGIFGANTFVPGERQEWGFYLMLSIMALGTLTAVLLFHESRRRWVRKWQRLRAGGRVGRRRTVERP